MKTCTKCKATKPESEFFRAARQSSGLTPACKACGAIKLKEWRLRNPERVLEQNRSHYQKNKVARNESGRKWKAANPEKMAAYRKANGRNSWLVSEYGITEREWDALFSAQLGVCAVCKLPPDDGRRLAVDHDHSTGKVRGLLHVGCNSALGHLRDSHVVVSEAANYLAKHKFLPAIEANAAAHSWLYA